LPESYKVEPDVLEAQGGNVTFSVNGTIPEKSFHKKAVVNFSPYLSYNGKTKELKKFTLRGEKTEGEGTVINSKTGGSFTYTETFPYEENMRASELLTNATISKGGKVTEMKAIKLADGVIETYKNIVHDEELSIAPSGYERVTIVSENATIYFKVNMSNINMDLPLNKSDEAKDKMKKFHDLVQKGWEIKDMSIDGWASPEGEISYNDNLAGERAASVQKYLADHITKINKEKADKSGVKPTTTDKEIVYNVKGHGEDWDGFMTSVKNSSLKDKNQILNVINSQSDNNKREEEIRNMTVIYKEIEDDILPPLRKALVTVNCFEPKRTDEDIIRLSTTSPDSLTYIEMLHAASLIDNPLVRYNIYKSAFTKPDRDWKAYNNAAAEAITIGKSDEAENFLTQASTLSDKNGKIENNKGVLACRKDDFNTAEKHFLTAQSFGENENYNLGIVMIQKGEYQKALNYFKGLNCRHNVALVQLLSGNMNESLSNLKCAPQSPHTFYMMAVYGARTNDQAMVIEYLGKAISEDGSLKENAATDREFIKYFEVQEFINLVM
jgi:outer membrane protein OmpA-like peptidoglycan-associated protein/tetratricopeptide (TPR) repeat protein